jgi:Family of unknown function (DUF6600)
MMNNYKLLVWGIVIIFLCVGISMAQEKDEQVSESGIRYSRMSIVSGDVTIQLRSEGEEQPARMNYPFLEGDRLVTGEDGAVEIQFDDGSIAWLYHDSKIDMSELGFGSDKSSQVSGIRLWVGDFYVRIREPANLESTRYIEMGSARLYAPHQSFLRILMEPDGSLEIYVKEGTLQINGSDGKRDIQAGDTYRFDTMDNTWREIEIPESDAFDEWVIERDKYLGGAYHTDNNIPDDRYEAYADFHGHGRWMYNVYLGSYCWSPFVSIGWAPYHFGYWDWIPGWGWTWIPDEPWGWTAYHYGYWAFYYEYGWIWVPHWRWGSHWASWRTYGRSVHWIPIHPRDKLDSHGRLMEGSIPKNSRLELGIPVEAGQSVDDLLQRIPVQSSQNLDSMPTSTGWRNNPPVEITRQARESFHTPGLRQRQNSINPGTNRPDYPNQNQPYVPPIMSRPDRKSESDSLKKDRKINEIKDSQKQRSGNRQSVRSRKPTKTIKSDQKTIQRNQ